MISQDLSQFALHARAILALPIPNIHFHGSSASSVILAQGDSASLQYSGLQDAVDTAKAASGKVQVHY